MAFFCEYPLPFEEKKGDLILHSSWSNNESNKLVALSTTKGVIITHHSGQLLEDEPRIQRDAEAVISAFHPNNNLLVTGWDDGTISAVGELNKAQVRFEDSNAHTAAISMLVWGADGRRLVSADHKGVVTVWGTDKKGPLSVIQKYEKGAGRESPVTVCVFVPNAKDRTFYFGGEDGEVNVADDRGSCTELCSSDGAVISMNYSILQGKNKTLTVLSHSGAYVALSKLSLSSDRKTKSEKEFKLDISDSDEKKAKVNLDENKLAWIGEKSGEETLLAIITKSGKAIRVWNFEQENVDESYQIPVPPEASSEIFRCLTYQSNKRLLVAGTNSGRIYQWRYHGQSASASWGGSSGPLPSPSVRASRGWDFLPSIDSHIKNVIAINPGPTGALLVRSATSCSILKPTILKSKTNGSNSVIQLSPRKLLVRTSQGSFPIKTSLNVAGLDINQKFMVVWDGIHVEVWDLSDGKAHGLTNFKAKTNSGALSDIHFIAASDTKIDIFSLQGDVKSMLSLTEVEGNPVHVHSCNNFLVVATTKGLIKLWNISNIEKPKLVVPPRLAEEIQGRVVDIQVNSDGSKIAILTNRPADDPADDPITETRLCVYDVRLEKNFFYEFGPNYYPSSVHWDPSEAKLLVVQSKKLEINEATKEEKPVKTLEIAASDQEELPSQDVDLHFQSKLADAEVAVMFVSSEHGVLLQDSFGIDPRRQSLVGIEVPHIYLAQFSEEAIERKLMSDFVGLDKLDAAAKQSLVNFSYYVTVGSITEALSAVKTISSSASLESIWKNMAIRCVKTKRLDIALLCLAQLGNAHGARALRRAMKEPEPDVPVAMLAVQLGMIDEAERLYRNCKRYDLLGKLYQATGRWQEAIQMCKKHDRIHLYNTHFNYAKHLESTGQMIKALKQYERSRSHDRVGRLLFDSQHDIKEVEAYIQSSHDPALYKWFGQYQESQKNIEQAMEYYSRADDTLSQVRLLCQSSQIAKAEEVCRSANDVAASIYLARYLENQEPPQVERAIDFYAQAKQFKHAIRLVKTHGVDHRLSALAEESSPQTQLDAAKYLESKGIHDKAIRFYQKGGDLKRAVELCFESKHTDQLNELAPLLNNNVIPLELLVKVAGYFHDSKAFDKAVKIYISAAMPVKALELCNNQNVIITEELAELLTPTKAKDAAQKKERNEILLQLANCLKNQGSYALACKKFTQAGNNSTAMECLLQLGEAEKIINYANLAKKPETYIMAADFFFQKYEWHNHQHLMDTIINFYSKARASEKLSNFFEVCAQLEIDDFSAYDKAAIALKESQKWLQLSKVADREERLANLDKRISLVNRYVEARRLIARNPEESMRICEDLLVDPDIDAAVRVGDVYGTMFEFFIQDNNMGQAYSILERMREADIPLEPYVDEYMVETVYEEIGGQKRQASDVHDEHPAVDLPTE